MIYGFSDGHGYLMGDWALAVLVTVASVSSWWNIVHRGHSCGSWLIAIGFTTLGIRLVSGLVAGGDPLIPPVSLMAMSLVSSGWSLKAFRTRRNDRFVPA